MSFTNASHRREKRAIQHQSDFHSAKYKASQNPNTSSYRVSPTRRYKDNNHRGYPDHWAPFHRYYNGDDRSDCPGRRVRTHDHSDGNNWSGSSSRLSSSLEHSCHRPVRFRRTADRLQKTFGSVERRYEGQDTTKRRYRREGNVERGYMGKSSTNRRERKQNSDDRRDMRVGDIERRCIRQNSDDIRYMRDGDIERRYMTERTIVRGCIGKRNDDSGMMREDSIGRKDRREADIERRYIKQDVADMRGRGQSSVGRKDRREAVIERRYIRQHSADRMEQIDDAIEMRYVRENDDVRRSRREADTKRSRMKENSVTVLSDHDHHLVWSEGDMLLSRYRLVCSIGEGAFARVLKAEDTHRRQTPVAVKIFKSRPEFSGSAEHEADVLRKLERQGGTPLEQHHVIRLMDSFQHGAHACLVFPLLGLSVYDFMSDNHELPYPLPHVRRIGRQLCGAVCFLHSCGVIHTDIKPENILLVDSACDVIYDSVQRRDVRRLRRLDVCLIDFGSVAVDQRPRVITTRPYRAPEVVLELGWDRECDVWSVGCVLSELYTGRVLFPADNRRQHLAAMQIVLGHLPSAMISRSKTRFFDKDGRLDCNIDEYAVMRRKCVPLGEICRETDGRDGEALLETIAQMLQYQPRQRVTMKAALQLPFFLHDDDSGGS